MAIDRVMGCPSTCSNGMVTEFSARRSKSNANGREIPSVPENPWTNSTSDPSGVLSVSGEVMRTPPPGFACGAMVACWRSGWGEVKRPGSGALGALDDDERLVGVHHLAGLHEDLGNGAGPGGLDVVLHLHRLEDADRLPGLDRGALLDQDLQDRALHRRDDRVAAAVVRAAGAHRGGLRGGLL